MHISFHGHRPSCFRTSAQETQNPPRPTVAGNIGPVKNINLGFLKLKLYPRQTALQESQLRSLINQPKTPSQAAPGATATLAMVSAQAHPSTTPLLGAPLSEKACRAQLPQEALSLYDDVGLRVTLDTIPKSQELGHQAQLRPIGSGSISTVYLAEGTQGGSEFEYAFKPLTKTLDKNVLAKLGLTQMTGIPVNNRQVGMRNMATQAYSKLLDFNVIVDTSIQVCNVPVGHSGKTSPQVGLLMAKVEGMDPAYLEFSSLEKRAEVTREITKLQLLDHLTGEVDRHSGNFKVQIPDNSRAQVIGFDNDLSFGKKLLHPESFTKMQCKHFHGSLLPPVVDRQMFDAINNVTPEQVKGILENKLDDDEVNAALERLKVVKQHVLKLQVDGLVINNLKDWASPQVLNKLDAKNSYVARLEFVSS